MNLLNVLIFISSLSFIVYGISYFTSTKMKSEFKRFGLEKAGAITAILELSGALGLIIGLKVPSILIISAGGLALLMLLGIAVRIKVGDNIWITLPAIFFMLLNASIFFVSLPLI